MATAATPVAASSAVDAVVGAAAAVAAVETKIADDADTFPAFLVRLAKMQLERPGLDDHPQMGDQDPRINSLTLRLMRAKELVAVREKLQKIASPQADAFIAQAAEIFPFNDDSTVKATFAARPLGSGSMAEIIMLTVSCLVDYLESIGAVHGSHGIEHVLSVFSHTVLALSADNDAGLRVTNVEALATILAALLHDVDDRKLFPGTIGYPRACAILRAIGTMFTFPVVWSAQVAPLVIRMIGWVSTSTNGNAIPEGAAAAPWMLYPRFADRIEAIGARGVERCLEYTLEAQRPLFTAETPRPRCVADIRAVATPARFAEYKGKSASMLDHYYDKLLHIGALETKNPYLLARAADGTAAFNDVLLVFGALGRITPDIVTAIAAASGK
jgi:uncharacterized protein